MHVGARGEGSGGPERILVHLLAAASALNVLDPQSLLANLGALGAPRGGHSERETAGGTR